MHRTRMFNASLEEEIVFSIETSKDLPVSVPANSSYGKHQEKKVYQQMKSGHVLQNFFDEIKMKDLEKIAPKQKGIVPQSVKEVTQILVDEGLVECEKIGTFVCYWAFPSQATIMRKRQLEELDGHISNLETKVNELRDEIVVAKKKKEVTEERKQLETEIHDLKLKHQVLKEKLDKLNEEGPEAIRHLESGIAKARDDANRWTENVFAAKKWCKKKFNMEDKLLNTQFQIPPDLDYMD
ncbi:unnamed protein product [Thelazia callipaeda]|uniref:Meiotic nuclear division protein 1 homolog n=1 Tax=Thelazia callipaeda TaxID=103827 RepID=A0A0N5CKW4_THECL|nr:unnamed protein product [Thelazia callipaeda]